MQISSVFVLCCVLVSSTRVYQNSDIAEVESHSAEDSFWKKPDKTPPVWNNFRVTWPRYKSKPKTMSDAKEEGFAQENNKCSTDGFVLKGESYAASYIYNFWGVISGIRTCILPGHKYAQSLMSANGGPFHPQTLGGKNYNCVYMMFRDPKFICTGSTTKTGTGDGLWIKKGGKYEPLVTGSERLEENVPKPFVKGKCFKSMGVHYWYDIKSDMDCSTMFPVFLLYNNGKLNGWGWIFVPGPTEKNPRFENPSPRVTTMFLPEEGRPTCVTSSPTDLTSMHIAFQNPLFKNFC